MNEREVFDMLLEKHPTWMENIKLKGRIDERARMLEPYDVESIEELIQNVRAKTIEEIEDIVDEINNQGLHCIDDYCDDDNHDCAECMAKAILGSLARMKSNADYEKEQK